MQKIEISKDKKAGAKVDVTCRQCKRSTKHLILSEINLSGEAGTPYSTDYHWNNDYQIVQCQGCELVSFRETHENSEDVEPVGYDEYETAVSVTVYPNPEAGRLPLQDEYLLPDNLERIYLETIKSINGSQPVLTGIGIRAIVETVCKDKCAAGSDLFQKINGLVTQGVLTKDGADILHKLRTLGNESAHEVKPHDAVQLGLALDVIDHLLQGVYIIPYHAKNKFK